MQSKQSTALQGQLRHYTENPQRYAPRFKYFLVLAAVAIQHFTGCRDQTKTHQIGGETTKLGSRTVSSGRARTRDRLRINIPLIFQGESVLKERFAEVANRRPSAASKLEKLLINFAHTG